MITHIYVDMDGVLADFYKRFNELFNQKPERDYPSNTQRKKAYINNWHEFIKGEHFMTLDPMPDLQLGLTALRILHKKIPVEILGSTAKPEFMDELSRQKTSWLKSHGIEFHPIFVPGKQLKRQYAGPGKVLIDDTGINIDQWNADGGIGILHTDWYSTLEKLKNEY